MIGQPDVTHSADSAGSGEMSDELFKDFTALFKLLSDETRLRILVMLSEGNELHVRELCERLGQSQPAVSHHLALLRLAALVQLRREGKYNFYRLNSQRLHDLLGSFFSALPHGDHTIQFDDFVLSIAPRAHQG